MVMTSRSPQIVFCTTCRGRAEHIKRTLPANLSNNRQDYSRFLLLNYNSQDDLLHYIVSRHKPDLKSGRLILYSYPTDGPFHIAHAKNLAARLGILAGADLIVALDADNFTGPSFDQYIYNQFSCGSPIGPDTGMFLYADINKTNRSRFARGVAGRLVIRSQDFIKLGGYDERFDTWRGEDMDMNARLWRLGYGSRPIDPAYLDAIRHSADVRFREYPHARQYENDEEVKVINRAENTVVNGGRFGMGTVYRNFDPAPVVLGPVPTRVFGIGLHKTATSSLHKAFQTLGFDSLHWGTGEAPLIWNEMSATGRSKTLERYYALSDLPIPLLYRQLDTAYPGSKFILTIRDDRKWLTSIERLWDPAYNPTRWEWDIYPFTNRIHTELYGTRNFDPDRMLERYRRHNREVKEYFGSRPGDLLVMDMESGAGWPELCAFLDKPVPAADYPVEYRTRSLIDDRTS